VLLWLRRVLKKETIIDFTTEVEYISMFEVAKEVIRSKKFITELGGVPSIIDLVVLYYNNNGIILQVKELRSHQ
jgi:hypothetical protein